MPKGAKGARHYRWNTGIGRHAQGYVKVRIGKEHPLADRNGWTYLHKLIWWAAGRKLSPGQILHHKNGNKQDNRLENLEATSRSEHNRHHNKEKKVDPITGRFVARAGRQLDGREWNEFPKETARV